MKVLPLAFALALGAAAGPEIAEAAHTPHVDAIRAPSIDFRMRVLPNGLKVYSLEDHSTQSVAIQIWYGVGAKNDPPGRSGMAHLCEHMMFRGSRNLPPGFVDRLT